MWALLPTQEGATWRIKMYLIIALVVAALVCFALADIVINHLFGNRREK